MGSKKKTTVYTTKTVNTSVVKLSYLQTLALTQGLSDVAELETPASSENLGGSSSSAVKNLGLTKKGSKSSSKLDSSGVKVKDQWLNPYFDRIRYTIGIRELSIAKYTFAERSEIVSVPFVASKEVIKVHLMVDEYIPAQFDNSTNWISYYIKAEESEEWIEVAPLNLPTRFNQNGEVLPKIVNFNIPKPAIVATENKYNYTPVPVQGLRFKAIFTRPTGGSYDSITPLLKSYRMIMTPRD